MKWTRNPGKPPRTDKPLFIRWSTGGVEGPFDAGKWKAMRWSRGGAVDIAEVSFLDEEGN